jgi:lambda family phage portal protein
MSASMSYAQCAAAAARAHARLRRAAPARPPRPGRRSNELWKGTEVSRLTFDWYSPLVPADDEIRNGMTRLRARARELARNNPYVRQFLNLLRVNVIGPDGFKLQAQVRNNDGKLARFWNDRIEAAWHDWSRAPTTDGRLSCIDAQQLALTTVANDGEALVRMHRGDVNRYGLALELVDPDLLDEAYFRQAGGGLNEIRMGVEVDTYGRPVAYHLWDGPVALLGLPSPERTRMRIPADQIIHLYAPNRFNQTRGVTWLAPVMYSLNMQAGYAEAEITAARVGASSMGFFTRKDEAAAVASKEGEAIQFDASPGSLNFAPEGYDFATWDPSHPNSNYPGFIKAVLREIASGLGLSYNVLANDLEGVNYSSMRSGLLIERDLWRNLQRWWVSAFLDRVYTAWLEQSLLAGGLVMDTRDPRKWRAARWAARGWPWVDPSKDVDASIKGIQTGLDSRTDALAEQGKDLEDVLERLANEKKLAAEYGVDIDGPAPAGAAAAAKPEPEDEEEKPVPKRNGTVRPAVAAALRNGGH